MSVPVVSMLPAWRSLARSAADAILGSLETECPVKVGHLFEVHALASRCIMWYTGCVDLRSGVHYGPVV